MFHGFILTIFHSIVDPNIPNHGLLVLKNLPSSSLSSSSSSSSVGPYFLREQFCNSLLYIRSWIPFDVLCINLNGFIRLWNQERRPFSCTSSDVDNFKRSEIKMRGKGMRNSKMCQINATTVALKLNEKHPLPLRAIDFYVRLSCISQPLSTKLSEILRVVCLASK